MINEPTPEPLAKLPPLYSTDHIACEDKIIHLHFYIPGLDSRPEEILAILEHITIHNLPLMRAAFHWYIAE